MNTVITSILEAEEKADLILKEAQSKAKVISRELISKSDSIKEEAISSFRVSKKEKILEAEKKAEREYQVKIKAGEKLADEMISQITDRIDRTIKETVNIVLEGK